jgi:hypothetical protein
VGIVGARLLFSDATGRLWGTDGTAAGTIRLGDVAYQSTPVACGGWTYWSDQDGVVHRFDASAAGSVRIEHAGVPQRGRALGCVRDTVVLIAEEHWDSVLLDALGALQIPGELGEGVFADDVGYLRVVPPGAETASLLRTDGTGVGTSVLLEGERLGFGLGLAGERLFYCVESAFSYASDLFASVGTPGSGVLVGSLWEGGILGLVERGSLRPIASLGDRLLYVTSAAIWSSDGTVPGTAELHAFLPFVSPTNSGESVASVVTVGQMAYVAIGRGSSGSPGPLPSGGRIIQTDGRPAGTAVVAEWTNDTRGLRMAFAADTMFVMGPTSLDDVDEPPATPCVDAPNPLACELDGLRASLRCRTGAPSALRRPHERKMERMAQAIAGPGPARARRSTARALRLLARVERWFGRRRTIAKLQADCAGPMAQQVADARARLAARGVIYGQSALSGTSNVAPVVTSAPPASSPMQPPGAA